MLKLDLQSLLDRYKINAAPVPVKGNGFVMPPFSELRKSWSEYSNHRDLYYETYAAYWFLARYLTAKEFHNPSSDFNDTPTASFLAALNSRSEDYYYMNVQPKYIETKVPLKDIPIKLSMGKDAQSLMDAETIIRSVFPSFKMPTKWSTETKQETDEYGTTRAYKSQSIGEDQNVFLPVEKIASLKARFTPQSEKFDKKFAFTKTFFGKGESDKDQKRGFNNIAFLDLTLKQSDVLFFGNEKFKDAGTLQDSQAVFQVNIEAELVYRWPIELVYYVTCATGPDNFIPFLFYQWMTWHKTAYGTGRLKGGSMAGIPARINHLGNILERNEKERVNGRTVKIRANPDNFVILGVGEPAFSGEIYWIPPKDNKIADYLTQIKSAYDQTSMKMDLSKVTLKSEGLFTDPYNEKYTYFRDVGTQAKTTDISGINTIDLVGSVPLDDVTIYKELNSKLSSGNAEFVWYMSVIGKYVNGDYKVKPSKDFISEDSIKAMGINYNQYKTPIDYVKDFQYYIESYRDGVIWANISGYPLDDEDQEDDQKPKSMKLIRAICNLIKEISNEILSNFDKLDIPHSRKINAARFVVMMITKYGANFKQYHDNYQASLQKHDVPVIKDADFEAAKSSILVPNLTGLTKLMPHQLETRIQLSSVPNNSLIAVDVGGGKTSITIVEIANLLYTKKIRKPLMIVPNNLVRNWANEIYGYSKGKMNAFVLNIDSIRRLQYVYTKNADPMQKPDYAMLKRILDNLPINTIVVTSFNFLKNDKEDVVYGNKVISRLYIADFMRDYGFDYIGVDESHSAKNLTSKVTLGTSIVQSAGQIKRCLSGTTVIDNLTDLVGQTSLLAPSALGSKNKFLLAYKDDTGNTWKDDAIENISKEIRPYIQKIVHKKQEWAHMLPKLHENFHHVKLTAKQQEFYNSLITSAFDDLKRKNPKLYAKLMDGNEDDDDSIVMGLSQEFQPLEQFIYAPDSNQAFLQMEGLEPEDYVSPKLAKVVEILDNHFNGYTDALKRVHPGSKYKVIIFSHRRKTSEHMYKHMPEKYKRMSVRYVANDFKALQKFLKNPEVKILIADELSITTGHNFQLANRMIRLETLWSPGIQEQALGRIWRPAFKEGSERQSAFLDWIFTTNTLEVAKVGRFISKIISKTRYDQQHNPRFMKDKFVPSKERIDTYKSVLPAITQPIPINYMLNELPLIKMNNKTFRVMNSVDQLRPYFASYALLGHWEDREFELLKADPRYNKNIDLPKSAYVEIPNSKPIPFIPRVPGIEPAIIDPEDKFEYKPVSIVESENEYALEDNEDNDNEETDEINPVEIGEIVDTEFGFGVVSKLLQKDLWVDIKGIGNVRVPKTTAWIIGNDEQKANIRKLIEKSPGSLIRLPEEIKNVMKIKAPTAPSGTIKLLDDIKSKAPEIKKPEPVDEFDDQDEVKDHVINIFAEIVDTQIALTTYADKEKDSDFLIMDHGFKVYPPYVSVKIPTAAALTKILNNLEAKFTIAPQYVENFEYYTLMLQNHSIHVAKPQAVSQTLRFFGVEEHKLLPPKTLRPYPIIWGNRFYMAFNKSKTPDANKAIALIKSLNIPNLTVTKEITDNHMKFYKTSADAIAELKKIAEKITVPNLNETIDFLKSIKRKADNIEEKEIRLPFKEKDTVSSPVKPVIAPKTTPKPTAIKVQLKPSTEKTVKVATPAKPTTKKPEFKFNFQGLGKMK